MNHFIDLALAVPANAGVAAPDSAAVTSVWDFVVKGGLMMGPIILCSLITMTIVAERVLSLRRTRIVPRDLVEALRTATARMPVDPARVRAVCREHDGPVARVVAAGFRRADEGRKARLARMEDSAARELVPLRRFLRVLSVIAAIAPLMGLLGTIFGMIRAFQAVAVSGEALGKTEVLAGGIYEAMITTAAGLIVAIPSLLAFHWLSSIVQRRVLEVDELVHEVLDRVEGDVVSDNERAVARADAEAPATGGADLAPSGGWGVGS